MPENELYDLIIVGAVPRSEKLIAVEMEAAALDAFAEARQGRLSVLPASPTQWADRKQIR